MITKFEKIELKLKKSPKIQHTIKLIPYYLSI